MIPGSLALVVGHKPYMCSDELWQCKHRIVNNHDFSKATGWNVEKLGSMKYTMCQISRNMADDSSKNEAHDGISQESCSAYRSESDPRQGQKGEENNVCSILGQCGASRWKSHELLTCMPSTCFEHSYPKVKACCVKRPTSLHIIWLTSMTRTVPV
jgi:hypothetical protein